MRGIDFIYSLIHSNDNNCECLVILKENYEYFQQTIIADLNTFKQN